MFGRNIEKSKVEIRARVEHNLSNVFKNFYIAIWSCMKLEDVLEVLPMLMLKIFWMNLFLFGDVNNVRRHLVKLLWGPITI